MLVIIVESLDDTSLMMMILRDLRAKNTLS